MFCLILLYFYFFLSSMELQNTNPNLNSKLLCKCGLEIGKYSSIFCSLFVSAVRFVHVVDSGDLLKFVQFDWCFLITKCFFLYFANGNSLIWFVFTNIFCLIFVYVFFCSFKYNKRKINWFIPNNMKFLALNELRVNFYWYTAIHELSLTSNLYSFTVPMYCLY